MTLKLKSIGFSRVHKEGGLQEHLELFLVQQVCLSHNQFRKHSAIQLRVFHNLLYWI